MYYILLFFLTGTTFWLTKSLGDGIRVPKEIACVIGFLVISLFVKKRERYTNWFISGFCIWALCLTVFLIQQQTCFQELLYVVLGGLALMTLASIKTLVPDKVTLKTVTINPKRVEFNEQVKGIARFICWLTVIMSTYIYLQVLHWDSIHVVLDNLTNPLQRTAFTHRLVGTLGNPSIVSMWYAVTLPLFLLQRDKKFIAFFVYSFIPVILLQSAVGMVGCLVGFGAVLFYTRKRLLVLLVCLLLVSGYCVKDHPRAYGLLNPEGRVKAWKIIYDAWCVGYHNPIRRDENNNPLWIKPKSFVGYGPGMFQYIIPGLTGSGQVNSTQPWVQAHCEPLEIAFNYGVIGLFLYLGIWVSGIIQFLLQPKSVVKVVLFGSLMGLFTVQWGIFPFHIGATAFLSVVIGGLFLNLIRRDEKNGYEKVNGVCEFMRRAFTMRKCVRRYSLRDADSLVRRDIMGR